MYVPALATLIDGVVAPVDQSKLLPEVVKVELPQPFETTTTGALGIALTTIDWFETEAPPLIVSEMFFVPEEE